MGFLDKIFKKKVLEREVKSNNEFDSELEYLDEQSRKSKKETDKNREGIIKEEEEFIFE